ncbi:MAG: efflux RND transporter periplasmic adaptor subunit [Sandaracinaceae bacterium]
MRRRRSRRSAELALLTASFLVGCGHGGPSGDVAAVEDRPPVAIHVAVAEARQIPDSIALDGTLVADEESQVTSVVPGRVMEVLVERGDTVTEGQPLFRLRDVDYRLQARAARAQLDQARARLGVDPQGNLPAADDTPEVRSAREASELAQANLRRSEELAQRGVLSPQQIEEVRSRAATARDQYQSALNQSRASLASLASARVALSQASTSAGEATVRAPFAGEIANRMVSVGEYVSPQTPLVTLVRVNPLRLEVQIPQQSLRSVRTGQSIQLRVDALPDRVFDGTIRYISAAVQTATRGLTAEAVVQNEDGQLRPGMFATARLLTGESHAAAVVPARAVLTQAGVDRVFVVSGEAIEERVVVVESREGESVMVSEGVAEGERVATDHLGDLADGVRVTVGENG